MDFANMDETLTLKPSGGSDGKKSFKNMICLWNVEIKNWGGHSKLEMHYDLLEVRCNKNYTCIYTSNRKFAILMFFTRLITVISMMFKQKNKRKLSTTIERKLDNCFKLVPFSIQNLLQI